MNAAGSKLEEFTASLASRGKILANLLAKTHGAYFDEEFIEIANAELKNGSSFSFPVSELFSTAHKAQEKVGGLTLKSLRAAAMGWVVSTLSHAASINPESAIGDQDHAFKAAEGGIGKRDYDDDTVRQQTVRS